MTARPCDVVLRAAGGRTVTIWSGIDEIGRRLAALLGADDVDMIALPIWPEDGEDQSPVDERLLGHDVLAIDGDQSVVAVVASGLEWIWALDLVARAAEEMTVEVVPW